VRLGVGLAALGALAAWVLRQRKPAMAPEGIWKDAMPSDNSSVHKSD
jgi:hypothetical protein